LLIHLFLGLKRWTSVFLNLKSLSHKIYRASPGINSVSVLDGELFQPHLSYCSRLFWSVCLSVSAYSPMIVPHLVLTDLNFEWGVSISFLSEKFFVRGRFKSCQLSMVLRKKYMSSLIAPLSALGVRSLKLSNFGRSSSEDQKFIMSISSELRKAR
jgi:hypothetical protein